MRIAFETIYPEDLTLIEVRRGRQDIWSFLAFEDQPAKAQAIDDRFLVAMGEGGGFAIFDAEARQRVARTRVTPGGEAMWAYSAAHASVFVADGVGPPDDYDRPGQNAVRQLSLDGVVDRVLPVAPDLRIRWVGARDDGAIVCVGEYRTAIVDPSTGAVVLHDVPCLEWGELRLHDLRWFSPDARWALTWPRDEVERVVLARPAFWRRQEPAAPGHPDLVPDGQRRYGVAVELWSLDPPRRERRLPLWYATAEELKQTKPWRGYHDRAADDLKRLDHWIDHPPRTGTGKTAWEAAAGQPRLQHVIHSYLMGPITDVCWDADGGGFVATIDDAQRHVGLDGDVGALSPAVEAEKASPSQARLRAAKQEVRARSEQTLILSDLSAANLATAVREMADRMEAGLDRIMFRDVFRFRFQVGDKTLSERAIFRAIARRPSEAAQTLVPDLRRLVGSFGIQAIAHTPVTVGNILTTGTEPEHQRAPLSEAALCLARLDPRAFEVLREWFEIVDHWHDYFAAGQVFPAMARTAGFHEPGAVRFALWLFMRQSQTLPYAFESFPILENAQRLWTPPAFAEAALEEARRILARKGFAIPANLDDCHREFRSLLYEGGAWAREVMAAADELFEDATGPWDRP